MRCGDVRLILLFEKEDFRMSGTVLLFDLIYITSLLNEVGSASTFTTAILFIVCANK